MKTVIHYPSCKKTHYTPITHLQILQGTVKKMPYLWLTNGMKDTTEKEEYFT